MKLYLAGKMTGEPDHGFGLFRAFAAKLRDLGYEVADPSENFDGETGLARRVYMRKDIGTLLTVDGVAVLPNWAESVGARLEVAIAAELGLAVLDAERLVEAQVSPEHYDESHTLRRGDPRFHALLGDIGGLHDKKQADYGTDDDPFANVRASAEFGIRPVVGVLVRMNDKMTRLKTWARTGRLANEGAKDSMRDISVYGLIAEILLDEEAA